MRPQRLATFADNMVAFDTETHKITKTNLKPKMVLGSFASFTNGSVNGILTNYDDTMEAFAQLLDDGKSIITTANGSFDFAVMQHEFEKLGVDLWKEIFDLFEADRVFDILLAEALHAIANGHLGMDPRTKTKLINPETKRPGRYSLAVVTDLVMGRKDAKKNDIYRLRYSEFDGVPLDQLPQEAYQYPIDDVNNTGDDALGQVGIIPKVTYEHNFGPGGRCLNCGQESYSSRCVVRKRHRNLHDHSHQVRAHFALNLGSIAGFDINQDKVDIIEKYALRDKEHNFKPFTEAGLIRPDGTENRAEVKRRVAIAYGCTETCKVCLGLGRIQHPNSKLIRCKVCGGKSALEAKITKSTIEWLKANPDGCNECNNTGKIKDPKHTLVCEDKDDAGNSGLMTCDGTGFVLVPEVPRSESGAIGYGRDPLSESGDEFLMAYAEALEGAKILATYIPALRLAREPDAGHAEGCPINNPKGACTCDGPFHSVKFSPRYNVLLESGRVSAEGIMQLLPRQPGHIDKQTGDYVPSLRECFEPRTEYLEVEVSDDYVLQPGEYCED